MELGRIATNEEEIALTNVIDVANQKAIERMQCVAPIWVNVKSTYKVFPAWINIRFCKQSLRLHGRECVDL